MMKTTRSFLLTGAIALTAMALNTACSERDINPVVDNTPSWDAAKISGDVVGMWYGESRSDATVKAHGGKYDGRTLYGNKEVQAFQFNPDGTGICYEFLCNVAGEAIDMFGGMKDTRNGRFTYTTNPDSTITITRVGDGNVTNPKQWQAFLTKDGLQAKYGGKVFSMIDPNDWRRADLVKWEENLRPTKAATRADVDTVWVSNHEWYDESFLTDWWHQGSMELSGIGTVHTPWGDSTTNDGYDIPSAQRYYNSASNGWEMCFCKFNDVEATKIHYFALYNKWTGTMRVFFWANEDNVSDYGNELIFYFMSDDNDELKTPLYHAMTYGIPANHHLEDTNGESANLLKNFSLTGSSGSSCTGWHWYASPFSRSAEANGVEGGWHCVDFDMSAWSPYADDWATSAGESPLFTLRPLSRSTSSITLTGDLTGSVQGTATTYSEEEVTSSSCPGFSSFTNALSSMSSSLMGVGMNLGTANKTFGWGVDASKKLTGYGKFCGGLALFSVGVSLLSGICSIINNELQTTETQTDSTVTKMDMTIDADINLSGEIQKWTSVSDAAVDVKYNLMQKCNEDCNIGSGLWSLNEDPVVYLCKEALVSTQSHYTISASSSGLELSDFDDTDTRLVYFLDPSTIKININDDIYHNPRNVTLQCGVAIASDQELGHTDCYRDLLCLDDRSTFKISKSSTGNVKLSSSTNPSLTVLDPDDYKEQFHEDLQEMFETDSIDCDYTFKVTGPAFEFNGFKRMLFPEIYVPYDGSTIKSCEIPDLYVYVELSFDADEGEGISLIKHFIPKTVTCTKSEMSSKYDEICEYVENCENCKSTGTLNYPEGVDVYDVAASTLFKPMLYVMKQVLGK